MVVALIDDYRLVLLCATHHLLTATLAEVLDEDGEFLALIFLVLLCAHLCLELDQFVEAGYLGFFRNIVWQVLGGVGAGRSEYLNMKALSKPTSFTSERVC